ncbi:unnamed protein product [Effrenium voratum]|nr:unnamed protein product [Effrenium voratum]|mmetsp:Transcript_1276/g.2948  ORF Transcript_1276/g.2948 Transcript_1276/m.2948 type:complete len:316 (-) Transcript_1276:48-995(-)
MNKTRAMLDALMGPGRNQLVKDEQNAKEKFKDDTVCKAYLAGLCPFDASLLGGKRKFNVCEKIHSDLMKEQLNKHPDAENLKREYEKMSLRDLDFVIRECEAHIALENNRMREDVRRKKPPLPIQVNDRLAQMKRESSALLQKAESLDDDKVREKEALTQQANEVLKEREEVLEEETKKAIAALPPQEVCEVCGTSYEGDAGNAAHKKFRIHEAYTIVRQRMDDLKPRVEEWDKAQKEKLGDVGEKKKDKDNGKPEGSKSRARDKERDKDKERSRRDTKSRSRKRGGSRRGSTSRRRRRESKSRSHGRSRGRRRR